MDIAPYLHDDPDNPINKTGMKKKQEKELIEKSLAPALIKNIKSKESKAKSNLENQIKSSASMISKSASELNSSMKGKYIKRAEKDISRIAKKMSNVTNI